MRILLLGLLIFTGEVVFNPGSSTMEQQIQAFRVIRDIEIKRSLPEKYGYDVDKFVQQAKAITDYKTGKLNLKKLAKIAGKSKEEIRNFLGEVVKYGLIDEYFDIVVKIKKTGLPKFANGMPLLDKNIVILGKKIHQDLEGIWHMTPHIILVNSKGEILITKRSETKKQFPNAWEIIKNYLRMGEGYIEGALRKTEEEVGLKAVNLKLQEVDRRFLKIGKYGQKMYSKETAGFHIFYYDTENPEIYNNEISMLFVYHLTAEEKEVVKSFIEQEVERGEISDYIFISMDKFEYILDQILRGQFLDKEVIGDDIFRKFGKEPEITETPFQYHLLPSI